jgi:type I restriction enzyme R subunit
VLNDEAAFYDALADNMSTQDILGGDDQLRNISRELAESIKKSTSIDWTVKESVRAKIRAVVKHILRKYGLPARFTGKSYTNCSRASGASIG